MLWVKVDIYLSCSWLLRHSEWLIYGINELFIRWSKLHNVCKWSTRPLIFIFLSLFFRLWCCYSCSNSNSAVYLPHYTDGKRNRQTDTFQNVFAISYISKLSLMRFLSFCCVLSWTVVDKVFPRRLNLRNIDWRLCLPCFLFYFIWGLILLKYDFLLNGHL